MGKSTSCQHVLHAEKNRLSAPKPTKTKEISASPRRDRSGWVLYWGGDAYLSDPLEVGRVYRWTGNQHARAGDVALLYATAPVSALVGIFDVVSDARASKWAGRFQAHAFEMNVRLRRLYRTPLRLAVLRADPRMQAWGLVRAGFQMPFGRPPRVPPEILDRLLKQR